MKPDECRLIVDAHGQVHCLYDEAIDLAALGELSIARGSHVEPTADGHWTADLSPIGGPMLGPFPRRSDALHAERDRLLEQWLTAARPAQLLNGETTMSVDGPGPAENWDIYLVQQNVAGLHGFYFHRGVVVARSPEAACEEVVRSCAASSVEDGPLQVHRNRLVVTPVGSSRRELVPEHSGRVPTAVLLCLESGCDHSGYQEIGDEQDDVEHAGPPKDFGPAVLLDSNT
jgi:hypothetical protein